MRAPEFRGDSDTNSMAAGFWLNDVKNMLNRVLYDDQGKLDGVMSLLIEQASVWWNTVVARVSTEQITWEFFLREFMEMYIGDVFVNEMMQQFLNLKQSGKTIYEYECEFHKLSRFSSEFIPTEKSRIDRFVSGLDSQYKRILVSHHFTAFQEVVNKAKAMEQQLKIKEKTWLLRHAGEIVAVAFWR
ncbi:uncharacterized protein LOC120178782 [Hibiscus syriacus]|uniref:uncharacterized protein LOC120178782 n=1 Tax=Hibiscus syriacus TaxID=106335 RepID=UPI001922B49D|nr:uncharacterized protein LOC120178782 [Hibiscus syriacus]